MVPMHAKKPKEALHEPQCAAGILAAQSHLSDVHGPNAMGYRPQRRTRFSVPPPHVGGYFFNGLLTFGKVRETLVAETPGCGAVSRRKFSRMAR